MEAGKPHTEREKERIRLTILNYERSVPSAAERRRSFERTIGLRLASLQRQVDLLPQEQVARYVRLYALDKALAVDATRLQIMQTARADGYSLKDDYPEDLALTARMGLDSERSGGMSRADWVHFGLLDMKLSQKKPLTEAEIDSILANLRAPSKPSDASHSVTLFICQSLYVPPAAKRQEFRAAILHLLTSKNYWVRYNAKRALGNFGGSTPRPETMPKSKTKLKHFFT